MAQYATGIWIHFKVDEHVFHHDTDIFGMSYFIDFVLNIIDGE